MRVVLNRPSLAGKVQVPCSKSIAHRALICRYLAGGGELHNLTWSEDLRATEAALISLSAQGQPKIIECGASASTLRFLLPLALTKRGKYIFTGTEELGRRPLDPYFDIMRIRKITYLRGAEGNLPLIVSGKLSSGPYFIPGNISSQFVSGLLMALPLLKEDSRIRVLGRLESKPYVDLTLFALNYYGVRVDVDDVKGLTDLYIFGNQHYSPRNIKIEGDYSLAAVWLAAGLLGKNSISVENLKRCSWQGDWFCLDFFLRMGGKLERVDDMEIAHPSQLQGIDMDVRDYPDLVPVLAVLGCLAKGKTRIRHAARLRIKESNRLAALVEELSKLGAKIWETRDGLEIEGVERLHGGIVEGHKDHRIVMALALAALRCDGEVTIQGAEAVNKSYPAFWQDWQALGGSYAQ